MWARAGAHHGESRASEGPVAGQVRELEVEPARKQRATGAERDRRDGDHHLIEQPGVGELGREVTAADYPDVLAARGLDQRGWTGATSPWTKRTSAPSTPGGSAWVTTNVGIA